MLENPDLWRQLVREYGTLRRLEGMTRQARGQRFNSLIARLLDCFGVTAQANQHGIGEIDVTFNLGGDRFILEAKWERTKSATGPIAKLQRRIEQRKAGVTGILLAMEGFTPDAIDEVSRGRQIDVLLLDRTHWEGMLSGFVPPDELFNLITDQASFRGRVYTPLHELLNPKAVVPTVAFTPPDELAGELTRSAVPGVRAEVMLSGLDSRQLGIAVADDDQLLLTHDKGILAIDHARQRTDWAVPIFGCCNSPMVQTNGSILITRAYGVARYHAGSLTVVSSGAAALGASQLLASPDGSMWCLDTGVPSLQPNLIRLGDEVGDEQWTSLPLPPATAATWLSADEAVVAGANYLRLSTKTAAGPTMPSMRSTPAALLPIDAHRFLAVGVDLSLCAVDLSTEQQVVLADLTGVHGSACRLAAIDANTVLLAAYYRNDDGQSRIAVLRIRTPAGWQPTASHSNQDVEASESDAIKLDVPKEAPVSAIPDVPAAAALTLAQGRAEEHERGYRDALAIAPSIPWNAFERLAEADFDVARWLAPWRDGWYRIMVGQAPPGAQVPEWLPPMASVLGEFAAPSMSLPSSFTPTRAYMAGFNKGMKAVWESVVVSKLLPDGSPNPSSALNSAFPAAQRQHLLAIDEIRANAARARRKALWGWVGRALLWLATLFFGVMVIGGVGVALTGGWKGPSDYIIALLCFVLPFAGFVTWSFFDLRRLIRRNAPKASRPEGGSASDK